ncbi:MAG: neutral/alkaline non-lysosomal ceramidase N-terminal domain-containing protein [Saprospiraceae bacterium]|nr:neutral/alkaline non-lysosomal ceramidase N-terminal domain-containing protein [Saprospiraceae bacterium]
MRRTLIFLFLLFFSTSMFASDLYVGVSEVDITPKLPVALMGQFHLRIAEKINTPLTANVIILESRNGNIGLDTVVFVSCDLVYIPNQVWNQVRNLVSKGLPGFSTDKIILSATHTHTSPVLEDASGENSFHYKLPEKGLTQVGEYREFLVDKIAKAIISAWTSRERGSMSWGLGRAAVPYNRRVVYKDSEAVMYGKADIPKFNNIEGYEDHDVHSLFFWNKADELVGMAVEVACPAQEVEGALEIDADLWHPVRERLKGRFGKGVVVAGLCGAAGDQSPHPIYRKAALDRMRILSKISRVEDIAGRIEDAVSWTYDVVKNDKHHDVVLEHKVRKIELPMRKITVDEYVESMRISNEAEEQIARDPAMSDKVNTKMTWFGAIVKRYEVQKKNPNPQYDTEIHVIRMGDIVVCTNQFELFTDYGIQMQSRSKALQTIVVQLAGAGSYLPTEKAVRGGGYSAVCQSNLVGPEGGVILVEETLQLIDALWDE